jgi:hypothetical protein
MDIIILISKQDFCSHLGLGLDRQRMHVHGSGRLHPVMPETTHLGFHRSSQNKTLSCKESCRCPNAGG